MARRKVGNLPAIVKAYEADIKRAERNAKGAQGPAREAWERYAADTRRHLAALMRAIDSGAVTGEPDAVEEVAPVVKRKRATKPEPVAKPEPVRDEFAHLPSDQAAWARHLMSLEREDLARFARRREGVTI